MGSEVRTVCEGKGREAKGREGKGVIGRVTSVSKQEHCLFYVPISLLYHVNILPPLQWSFLFSSDDVIARKNLLEEWSAHAIGCRQGRRAGNNTNTGACMQ